MTKPSVPAPTPAAQEETRFCAGCGHEHQNARLAYICIGCPCPERPGKDGVGDE